MANANAIGEKLKDLGLRHGEKVGVAIASMAFFVCVGLAASKPTIDTTPEKIKQAAQQADSNLSRPEKRESIIDKLAEKGIKDTDFAKVVEEQVKTALVADNYKAAREWVTPEPGAGLIRGTPTLIAVTEVYAYPGRGGLLVYELDKEGNRIPDKDQGKDTGQRPRRKRKKRPAGGMPGMAGGGTKKKARKSQADIAREAKEEQERLAKELQNKLAGGNSPDEAAAKDEKETGPEFPEKETTKGFRWVAITGVLDHAKLVANYREALKNPAIAHPNYRRLDVQRQTLNSDGSWTKWESVSQDENLKVLDNLPEFDEELTPESVRPPNLVDTLPMLKAGLWEKVHIASLVPKEKKEVPKVETAAAGSMMNSMGGGMMADRMKMMGGMGGSMAGSSQSMRTQMEGMRGMAGMMGGMMGGMGGSESAGNYWRSEEKKVMIRAFDFTVQEDTTYRYRVRIVVYNPNNGREDVEPDVDRKSDELRGPWNDPPTEQVNMPPDVMPYAIGSLPPGPVSDMKVRFQVIRFHPADGVTVPKTFDAAPGEVIGEPRTADVPVSDGSGKKAKIIDFNSRQIVLDVFANKKTGGNQYVPQAIGGLPFVPRPSLALVLRPDGTVVLHNEAEDDGNEVRKDIAANYKHELSQSTKERKSSVGAGMMGSMMGRMGRGGMGGGGGGSMNSN